MHCTLYTVQCTLYTVHCTLYTVHCALYTVHCTLYTVNKKVSGANLGFLGKPGFDVAISMSFALLLRSANGRRGGGGGGLPCTLTWSCHEEILFGCVPALGLCSNPQEELKARARMQLSCGSCVTLLAQLGG